jgi:hypothetical protein
MKRPSKAVLWKAIRSFCLECVGDSPKEVEMFTSATCALHPYRLGMNNPIYRTSKKMSGTSLKNLAGSRTGAKKPLRVETLAA